jgi:hypothetical protein
MEVSQASFELVGGFEFESLFGISFSRCMFRYGSISWSRMTATSVRVCKATRRNIIYNTVHDPVHPIKPNLARRSTVIKLTNSTSDSG